MSPDLLDAFHQGFQHLTSTLIWPAFLIPIIGIAVFAEFLLKWNETVDSVRNDISMTVTIRIAAITLWISCVMYISISFWGLNDNEVWMACVLAYVQCITPAIVVLMVLGMGYFAWSCGVELWRRRYSREDVQAMPLREVVEGDV